MSDKLPEIGILAQRVRFSLYGAIGRFDRRDKYDVGIELSRDARAVVRNIRKAWLQSDARRRRILVQAVSDAIDELKDSMQLAGDVKAFRSEAEFIAIARLVDQLGEQCGGWLKGRQLQGQNDRTPSGQRAQTLSTPAASSGANA